MGANGSYRSVSAAAMSCEGLSVRQRCNLSTHEEQSGARIQAAACAHPAATGNMHGIPGIHFSQVLCCHRKSLNFGIPDIILHPHAIIPRS